MNASEQAYPFMAAIPKGWTIKRFGEVLAEPRRNGIYKTKEFHGRGQKIINMGELFAYDFISNQEMKRVELTSKELEKSLVQDGDLLFARRSLVLEGSGKCSLVVRPSEDTTFESSIIRARLNKNESEPKFYYYLFRSPLGRALMSSIATRTAVSGITGSNLVQLRVPCPPLFIQRKIAAILSAYDDLIENNRRRIEILEEMARSLYREWFVNFRFPGHEQVKMVNSELGLIPESWEVKQLGNIVLSRWIGKNSTM
jgi:type I restriction enzyme S subunit